MRVRAICCSFGFIITNSVPLVNTCNPSSHFQLDIESDIFLANFENLVAKNLSKSKSSKDFSRQNAESEVSRECKKLEEHVQEGGVISNFIGVVGGGVQ